MGNVLITEAEAVEIEAVDFIETIEAETDNNSSLNSFEAAAIEILSGGHLEDFSDFR